MITLSPELRRAVGEAGDKPVAMIDPETRQTYLIVTTEAYERLRKAVDAEEIDQSFFEIDDFEPGA